MGKRAKGRTRRKGEKGEEDKVERVTGGRVPGERGGGEKQEKGGKGKRGEEGKVESKERGKGKRKRREGKRKGGRGKRDQLNQLTKYNELSLKGSWQFSIKGSFFL